MSLQKVKILSLVLIRQSDKLLLGYKKRGFGASKYNGFGGKQEENETILECAQRELFEESGLTCTDLKEVGNLLFDFDDTQTQLRVTVFSGHTIFGNLVETDEMKPQWFDINALPYDQMWQDDVLWYPYYLKQK
ncbi:unnamed protein product, partial [Didymodactylos carnosus]